MPLLLLVFLAGCSDLFNPDKEDALLQKIDEQVRWDNAARLTVTVAVPEGWGTSPQMGTGRAGDTRKGFDFSVEFSPNSAWGFSGWIAVRSDNYNGADTDLTKALDGETVLITESIGAANARIAKVTISTTEPVTLVPWCEARPRIIQSNPPLINTGVTTSRGQQIKIYFAAPLLDTPENIKFGADHIEITGQAFTNTGDLDDPIDLTGVQSELPTCFNNPDYEASTKCITIVPDPDNLPLGDMMITVTVGTALAGANGNGMLSPVSFYYRTNNLIVQKTYNADSVAAIHDPSTVTGTEDFFYWNREKGLDRRLRKNSSGKYEVTLYFSVSRSSEEIAEAVPGSLKIAEVEYANLGGDVVVSLIREKNFPTIGVMENGDNTAGYFYRQTNTGTAFYKAVYTWDTPPASGIIRLVVLPYRSGADAVAADTWQNAMAAGRFAAVVMDDQAPGGSASLALSGQATISGGTYNYNNTDNKILNMQANFSGIADNAGYGILPIAASIDKPWTRDAKEVLQWRYRIVTDSGSTPTVNHSSHLIDSDPWYALTETSTEQDLSNLNGTVLGNVSTVRNVQVQYKDALGNTSGWDTMANIVYYTPAFPPVAVWDAIYSDTANSITVNWTTPETMTGVRVSVNGGYPFDVTGTGGKTHTITGVPRIDDSGVRQGQAVGNVTGYTVTLTAYNNYGSAEPTTVKIWNIPGMSNIWNSRLIEIADNGDDNNDSDGKISLKYMATNNPAKKYVLTDDITLTGAWAPIGIGPGAAAFQGKFYGNGHTIKGLQLSLTSFYSGLFGYTQGTVSGSGETGVYSNTIRDLKVELTASDMTNATSTVAQMGGVAGCADGTEFRNVLVEVPTGITAGMKNTNSTVVSLGGIAGYANSNIFMDNCRSIGKGTLKLIYNGGSSFITTAGGLIGFISSGGTAGTVIIQNSGASVNMTLTKEVSDIKMAVGGIVGYSQTARTLKNISYSEGVITFSKKTNAGTYENYVGGLAGQLIATSIDTGSFSGTINIPTEHTSPSTIIIGGGIGTMENSSGTIENVTVTGALSYQGEPAGGSAILYMGGVVGFIQRYSDEATANIKNCKYTSGNITVTDATSSFPLYVGGFVGQVQSGVVFTNSYASAGLVQVAKTKTGGAGGALYVGGFAGHVNQVDINGCYSTSNVKIPNTHTGTAACFIGGFAGFLEKANVKACYATGDIESYGLNEQYIGGLMGYSFGSSGTRNKINRCYATGALYAESQFDGANFYYFSTGGLVGSSAYMDINESYASGSVTAKKRSSTNGPINAGGLVGYMSHTNSIKNSWASGTVLADNPWPDGGAPRAGGLVGLINPDISTTVEVAYCFSLGSVIAQSNNSASGYGVMAGGLVGDFYLNSAGRNANIHHCVFLGASVSAASGSTTTAAGRVYGSKETQGTLTLSANYASTASVVETAASYYALTGTRVDIASPAADSQHGANVSPSVLKTSSFWSGSGTNQLDFDGDLWDFNRVVSEGAPRLRNIP
ncbi:hypothetical protein AGMMS50293_02550 [Spirochaetia bacterium]|nr:hypothetical protein AGMMS50293_02550 [Spirochaetia bacterium]